MKRLTLYKKIKFHCNNCRSVSYLFYCLFHTFLKDPSSTGRTLAFDIITNSVVFKNIICT